MDSGRWGGHLCRDLLPPPFPFPALSLQHWRRSRSGHTRRLASPRLQPGHPCRQTSRRAVQRGGGQGNQTQLHVRAPVGGAGQIRPRLLHHPEHLHQPGHVKALGQAAHGGLVIAPRHQGGPGLGGGFAHQQITHQGGQLAAQSGNLLPPVIQPCQPCQGVLPIAVGQGVQQGRRLQIARQTQGGKHPPLIHRAAPGEALVQQGQGVPHTAVCQAGNEPRPLRGEGKALLLGHILQVAGDFPALNALEGKLLAAALDGGGHLVQLCGGQDEHQVFRRLLQGLEQGVEGLGGQGVHLVDDIHPLFHCGRGVHRLIQNGPDVVHPVVGGGVQLHHI